MKKKRIIPICLATLLTIQALPLSSFASEISDINDVTIETSIFLWQEL